MVVLSMIAPAILSACDGLGDLPAGPSGRYGYGVEVYHTDLQRIAPTAPHHLPARRAVRRRWRFLDSFLR